MIDAHVHAWDQALIDYPWMGGNPIAERASVSDVISGADRRITEWIFVEADPAPAEALRETQWISSLEWPGLVGIVAHIDLDDQLLPEILTLYQQLPLVRGVRQVMQDWSSTRMTSASVRDALRGVAAHGFTFDVCVRWRQLPEVLTLAQETGDLVMILDHLGKPPVEAGLGSEEGRAWVAHMEDLADGSHILVKVSGLPAETTSAHALEANATSFMTAALQIFGPERCMFGSDWPVSTGTMSTQRWADLVDAAVGTGGSEAVFDSTARKAYRIAPAEVASAATGHN